MFGEEIPQGTVPKALLEFRKALFEYKRDTHSIVKLNQTLREKKNLLNCEIAIRWKWHLLRRRKCLPVFPKNSHFLLVPSIPPNIQNEQNEIVIVNCEPAQYGNDPSPPGIHFRSSSSFKDMKTPKGTSTTKNSSELS